MVLVACTTNIIFSWGWGGGAVVGTVQSISNMAIALRFIYLFYYVIVCPVLVRVKVIVRALRFRNEELRNNNISLCGRI